ncbi:hypothetical protein LCGC14_0797800 [marine sediment metagenome]|uniref:Uncharacterized protein n=1 Tax=marine sediment metagenome TaxID=412755 RepID=A0A0F9PUZ7_9ZZZZ
MLNIGLLDDVKKVQAKRLRQVRQKDLPFRQMMFELEKASVKKRLFVEARKTPAFTFNHNEMVKLCRLAYDGVEDNTYDFGDKLTEIGDDYNNLKNINKIFSPAGNVVIGHKVLKDYCGEYLSDIEKRDLRNSYGDLKTKIDNVMKSMEDESGTWVSELSLLGREHGVFTGGQHPVLYNIEEMGIKFPELASIAKEMWLYKQKYPNKEISNSYTAKTAAFKRFLEKLETVK